MPQNTLTTTNLNLTSLSNVGGNFTAKWNGKTSLQPIGTVTGLVTLQYSNDNDNFFDLSGFIAIDVNTPIVLDSADWAFYRFKVDTVGTGTVKWSVAGSEIPNTVINVSGGGSGNGVITFNTRTGNVVPEIGDYTTDQVTETGTKVFVTPSEKTAITSTQTEIDTINTTLTDFFTVDYINDLNAKQDVLASGDNIKTIDGFNVLGSGDIEILDSTNVFLFNDFLSVTALQPFVAGAISTGTLAQNTTNFSANTLGVGRVTKSTTANSGYRVVTDATSIRIKGGEVYKERFCPLLVSTATHRGGFMDATTVTESVDGIYFQYSNSGDLVLKTSNNSTRTTSSVLATLSLNTWYTAEIIVNSDATSVIMNLYNAVGTLIGATSPITTNIPTGVGRECGVGFVCTGSSVTADALADIDYIQFKQKITR